MKQAIKKRAIALRHHGWSYALIREKLHVSKGTLSVWLRDVPYTPNEKVRQRVNANLLDLVLRQSRLKQKNIVEQSAHAKKELGVLTRRDLWMIGIGLYIGEGSKAQEATQIMNSDPNVIRMTVRWLRDICSVPLENFTATMHIYPDISIDAAVRYWSRTSGIPKRQFNKTQVDARKDKRPQKQRKLPYGTLRITVNACGNPELGVLLHRRIMGWIKAANEQI